MINDNADVSVSFFNTNENKSPGNNLISKDLGASKSDSGENGKRKEKPKKFLLSRNALTYELELAKCTKNAMIIFNQENFVSPLRKRGGSGIDVKDLTETFEQFKFKVFTCDDYDKKYLLETVKGFLYERNYEDYGCICVALLTHGENGMLEASDRSFPDLEFFECFDARKNSSLAGKPIIIIVEACRGDKIADSVQVEVELPMMGDDDDQNPRFIYLPTSADMLIFRSCFSNTVSLRRPEHGSIFIQSLCRQIKQNPEQDFESICLGVKREVAVKYTNYREIQMPVVTSTLIRKLYFKDPGLKATVLGDDMKSLQMPFEYFLQYFKYIRKCLRLCIQRKKGGTSEKTDYSIAQMLLEQMEKVEHPTNHEQLMSVFIRNCYNYFKKMSGEKCDTFPEFDFVYFHYLLTEGS